MSNYVVSDTTLTAVANAIRSRTGKSAQIEFADGFVSEINGMIGKDYLDGHLVDSVASAPIASFPDGANGQPMLVTASITPVQDLSGGDPYPPGGGKNKCNAGVGRNDGKLRGDDGTESSTSSSGYTAPMDGFLPNTNYTISGQIQTANGSGRIYFLDSNGDWISRTTGFSLSEMPYTFTTPANCRYIEIQYNNAYTALTGVQIELGTTATSYSPYSHICPISGWTGAEVTGAGVNLFDKTANDTDKGFVSGYYLFATGTLNQGADWRTSEYIKVKPNTAYSLSGLTGNSPAVCFYDANKMFVSGTAYNGNASVTVTTGATVAYCRLSFKTDNINTVQIEEGSSASSYSAFDGTTLSVTFPNGMTVYGGSLKVNKDGTGVLTAAFALYQPSASASPGVADLGDGWARVSFSAAAIKAQPAKTPYNEYFSHGTTETGWTSKTWHGYVNNTGIVYLWFNVTPTLEAVQQFISAQEQAGTPIQLVYELATPVTYTLTSQQVGQLMAKMGVNHVWANCGNCAVEYSPDTDIWIQKVLAGESA